MYKNNGSPTDAPPTNDAIIGIHNLLILSFLPSFITITTITITVTMTSSHAKVANGFSIIWSINRDTLNPYSVNQSINCENGSIIPTKVSRVHILF